MIFFRHYKLNMFCIKVCFDGVEHRFTFLVIHSFESIHSLPTRQLASPVSFCSDTWPSVIPTKPLHITVEIMSK